MVRMFAFLDNGRESWGGRDGRDGRNALFEISHESDQFFQDSSMAKVMNTLRDPLHGHYHRLYVEFT
jgi:hypothetical protein